MIDIKKIIEYLPHRYPFLLVDRIIKIEEENNKIITIKNVTMNEPFFQGHFPGEPVMPGVLIIEAMAQTGGLLALHALGAAAKEKLIYFMGVDKVKFRIPVIPGDQLRLEVVSLRPGSKVGQFEAKAYVGDKLVAEGSLTAMMTDRKKE